MANLSSLHPSLAIHLSDDDQNPILTSSRHPTTLDALTSLSQTGLAAHSAAQRLGFGAPVRLIVEHIDDGPVLLQSFLPPPSSKDAEDGSHQTIGPAGPYSNSATTVTATNSTTDTTKRKPHRRRSTLRAPASPHHQPSNLDNSDPTAEAEDEGDFDLDDDDDDDEHGRQTPPLLTALVVSASSDEARDARRAAARLERVSRTVQAQLIQEQQQARGVSARQRQHQSSASSMSGATVGGKTATIS